MTPTTSPTITARLATHHHPHTARRFLTTNQFRKRTEPFANWQLQPPSIPTCPPLPPECSCADMPPGLDIERRKPLGGTMPPYAKHVVVMTGREEWGSVIEREEGDNFARSLKGLVRPGGKLYEPDRPILITNSSIPSMSKEPKYTSVLIFPNQVCVPRIPYSPKTHEMFVNQFLLGRMAFARYEFARRAARDLFARSGEKVPEADNLQALAPTLRYSADTTPTILICGHNSRDTRCGILGPILRDEFNSYIEGPLVSQPYQTHRELRRSRVALTSHIGGHSFAGNVIIYIPKDLMTLDGKRSPLAGLGIWYGRVEPRHVRGIMEETLLRGNIIEELLRGVHRPDDMGG